MDDRTRNARGEQRGVADGYVRLGSMHAWPRILDEFKVDTDALLASSGLVRADFGDPEGVASFRTIDTLLQRCAKATGCDDLGVLIGREGTLSSVGVVGYLMQASPTVGEALQLLQRHLHVHDRGAVVDFQVHADRAFLRYLIVVPNLEAVEQMYVIAGLIGCNLMRGLCGPAWRPLEVLLPFSPRRRSTYRDAFNAPLQFDAEGLTIVFPAAHLTHRPPTADPLLWQVMSERVQQIEAALRLSFPERVQRLLRSMVFEGDATPAAVARRLGVSPRTLHRRLAEAGTTVRTLRDEVLADAACQLLESTSKPATEIAAVLGYGEASAFTRAFRRWRGMAPTRWRAATGYRTR